LSGTGAWPTIVDFANRTDKDGTTSDIAELLSQCNYIYDDMPIKPASEMEGHKFTFRTSVPSGYWLPFNSGAPSQKSTTARSEIGLGRLADLSQVDKGLARISGDWEGYRATEDEAFLMGMGQTISGTLFYGNTWFNPAQFMGLAGFFNTLNTSAQNSNNIIDGGGTGSSNASLWLIDWGEKEVYGLAPRDSKAGIVVDNYGETWPGQDAFGNRFPAYSTWFEIITAICPEDWRRIVRYCNLDVTSAGLAGPTAADLFIGMNTMVQKLPTTPPGVTGNNKSDALRNPGQNSRAVFYCDRTIRHFLDVQAQRQRNVLLTKDDYDGKSVETYRNIPIKTVDQLLNTESRVTTASGPV
jgi:hypothetical protein